MEVEQGEGISGFVAVMACFMMAVFFVAILYTPTLILRLPPPTSLESFLIRRFICATVSSVLSIIFCSLILPIRSWKASFLFGVYGFRLDHMWQAVVYPVLLTSLIYAGSMVLKLVSLVNSWKEYWNAGQDHPSIFTKNVMQIWIGRMFSITSNIAAWRNYFVAPLTEELVFRACMIPLLLCGEFRTYSVIFFCPILFSLAHLHHFLEFYFQQNRSLIKASMVVGLQLGYTVIFGSYASFLFVRTGHLIAPVVAHVFCNCMNLPVLYSRSNGFVIYASIAGMLGFLCLLFPTTSPDIYNDRMDNCRCWQRYCSWN